MHATDGIAKFLMSGFSRLGTIRDSDPEMTPEKWCEVQPCVKLQIASREIILTQPTSTFFVYSLGVLTIGAGFYLLLIRGSEISRLLWGISLLLWGSGAILAGTSYQAFSYEIKCAGRLSCAWTSWWEVIYLIFQQLSMNTLLVAVAYSCTRGSLQALLFVYAAVGAVVYVLSTFIGGIVPIKSLITFELMVQVSTPIVLIFFIINGWRYYLLQDAMDLAFLGSWILLLISLAAYWLYDHLDITQRLWSRGIWFSQNDVLHISLIFWVIYIVSVVADHIKDYS